jgi:CRP-like cAMP-binding protein
LPQLQPDEPLVFDRLALAARGDPFAAYSPLPWAKGAALLKQGHPPDQVLLLRSGLVKLCHTRANGRSVIVGLRSRDSMLGVGPVLLGHPQTLTVVAITRCTAVAIGASQFKALLRSSEEISWTVHLAHSRETDRELSQLTALACLSARERLEEHLRLMREEMAATGSEGIPLPLKECELAELLGITPQWLCRLMQELCAEGRLVRQGTRWWHRAVSPGMRPRA